MTGPLRAAGAAIVLADTVTKLPPTAAGAVLVSGSHGGRYPGHLAAVAGVRAAIFNDAGIGLDDAGIGALPFLGSFGIAAAAVSHLSCLIGRADDMLERGVVSRANGPAALVGIREGCTCREAAELMRPSKLAVADVPALREGRRELALEGSRRRIVLLDSASLVRAEDADRIVITGSHGGLIGDDPTLALRADADVAAFNDAGRPDGPGSSRLPALHLRGIAAVTVSALSARIGDAESTFRDGVISVANGRASEMGARPDERLQEWLCRLAAAG